jgi:hypothetical protein
MSKVLWYLMAYGDVSRTAAAVINSFMLRSEGTKIISRLYDGTYHVQSIGTPAEYADMQITVDSLDGLRSLDQAAARADLLVACYRDVDYVGAVRGDIRWTPVIRGRVYQGACQFVLASEAP